MPTWQLQERCREVVSERILSFPCMPVCSHLPCVEANPAAFHARLDTSPSQTGAGHPGLMRAPSEAANGQQKHRRTEWLSALWYAAVLSDLLVIFLAGVFAPPGVKGHQGNQACSRSSCVRPHL